MMWHREIFFIGFLSGFFKYQAQDTSFSIKQSAVMEYVFWFLSDSAIKTMAHLGNPDRVTLP